MRRGNRPAGGCRDRPAGARWTGPTGTGGTSKGAGCVAAAPPRFAEVGSADLPRSAKAGDASTAGNVVTEERSEPPEPSARGLSRTLAVDSMTPAYDITTQKALGTLRSRGSLRASSARFARALQCLFRQTVLLASLRSPARAATADVRLGRGAHSAHRRPASRTAPRPFIPPGCQFTSQQKQEVTHDAR